MHQSLFKTIHPSFALADALYKPIYALFYVPEAVKNLYLFVAYCSQVLSEFL